MYSQIKADLPNLPDEVINSWLVPFAQKDGWPPESPRWRHLMPDGLDFWRKTIWIKSKLSLSQIVLDENTKNCIDKMEKAYIDKEQNAYSRDLGKVGEDKFVRAFAYLLENGTFPVPPILQETIWGYKIPDGNHRYLSWIYCLKKQIEFTNQSTLAKKLDNQMLERVKNVDSFQEFWIAKHI